MTFSLNEIEATAKHATRGAGYSWGLAEEAGKATRWLCAQDLDGAAGLSHLLEYGFASSLDCHKPKALSNVWTGDELLCPLITGASLSDQAATLQTNPVQIRRLAVPLMLLPFAANVARSRHEVITVKCGEFVAATDGARASLSGALPETAEHLEVTLGGTLTRVNPGRTRATPDPAAWDVLNRFAHRTYAPATEQSRLQGAGAGLSDND